MVAPIFALKIAPLVPLFVMTARLCAPFIAAAEAKVIPPALAASDSNVSAPLRLTAPL